MPPPPPPLSLAVLLAHTLLVVLVCPRDRAVPRSPLAGGDFPLMLGRWWLLLALSHTHYHGNQSAANTRV